MCIEQTLVCNGKMDCPNNQDEPNECGMNFSLLMHPRHIKDMQGVPEKFRDWHQKTVTKNSNNKLQGFPFIGPSQTSLFSCVEPNRWIKRMKRATFDLIRCSRMN